MKKIAFYVTIFILIGLLVGCDSVSTTPLNNSNATTSRETSISPTEMIKTSIEPSATDTGVSKTALPIPPTLTSTIVPPISGSQDVSNNCLTVMDQIPINGNLNGAIVLSNASNKQAFLLELPNGIQNSLLQRHNQEPIWFAVSPDGAWLAYSLESKIESENTQRTLLIVSANGQQLQQIPVNGYWEFEWLNNQTLLMRPDKWDAEELLSTTLLNPFTGQWDDLSVQLPDVFFGQPLYGWGIYVYSHNVISPDLNYVLYPQTGNGYENFPVALWDISAEKTVGQFPNLDFYGRWPRWSPDGQRVSIIMDTRKSEQENFMDEIFALSKDGQLEQLTFFSNSFTSTVITGYSWSPDSRRIAFWINNDKKNPTSNPGSKLGVLDIQTGHVTNYCNLGNHIGFGQPIWSPDGTQVLITISDANNSDFYSTILVDLKNNWAGLLAKNLTPHGWMLTP